MFIRNDLEKAIKDKFGIEQLVYQGIGKNTFNDFDLFLFSTDKGALAIELGFYKNHYYIYKIEELSENLELFYEFKAEINSLYTFGNHTYLKVNCEVADFQGKAFDFTQELVLLELEKE